MTTPRERVIQALTFRSSDRVPRDLWALPGVVQFRRAEYDRLLSEYPMDFGRPPSPYGRAKRDRPADPATGERTDAWGCVWRVAQAGVTGEVKRPPIQTWRDLDRYKPPVEILDGADFSPVNRFCDGTDLFVRGGAQVRPFERLQFLRGTEAALMDLAEGSREVRRLLFMLHEFFCRDMEMWAKSNVDALSFMDDWGSQKSLLISPAMWRSMFKPMYADYAAIARAHGKFLFMHSDGNIESIYPDLVEIGIGAINSQLFCMDLEGLAEAHRGKIAFYGEIDRQRLLPFGSTEEVREGVRRVRRALDRGGGGVIAQCEWGLNDPYDNIAAVFDEWEKSCIGGAQPPH